MNINPHDIMNRILVSRSVLNVAFYTSLAFLASLLTSCVQEDSQVEALKLQLNETKAELKKLKENSGAASDPELTEKVTKLESENESLRTQLDRAAEALAEAKTVKFEPISQDKLLVNLQIAAEPRFEEIRKDYEIQETTVTEIARPEQLEYPYKCEVRLLVKELATGQLLELPVTVKGDLEGKWIVPDVETLKERLRPASLTAENRGNPSPEAPSVPGLHSGTNPGRSSATSPDGLPPIRTGIVPAGPGGPRLPDGTDPNRGPSSPSPARSGPSAPAQNPGVRPTSSPAPEGLPGGETVRRYKVDW